MPKILTAPTVWQRPKAPRPGRTPDLTDAESGAVKAALRFLRARHGTWTTLAAALGTAEQNLTRAVSAKGRPSAALALRAARAGGVPLEDVLTGVWPPEGACPHCGRV
jgi:DNA-binding phage protein